jgi:hypothetical protein
MGGPDSGKLAGGVPVIESERIWRWPNHIVMSPSSLKAFGQCRYRNKLRYLQNIDPPDIWIRTFAMGNATHDALRTIAQQMKAGAPLITDDEIRFRARLRLPIPEYPSEVARQADIELVLQWVRRGQRYLERLHVEDWLLIESQEYREVWLFPAEAAYKLTAKPDLIIRRLTNDGQSVIHIVDWKTGNVYPEPDVPVIHRYVTRQKLQQWTGNASEAQVQFSWFWLDHGYPDDVDVSAEHCNHAWPDIMAQMEAMATETEWKATPGWYCRYCPYHENYCDEKIPYDD